MKLISFNINGIKSMTYKLKNGEKKAGRPIMFLKRSLTNRILISSASKKLKHSQREIWRGYMHIFPIGIIPLPRIKKVIRERPQ